MKKEKRNTKREKERERWQKGKKNLNKKRGKIKERNNIEKVSIMIFWGQEWSHPSGVLSATITLVASSTRFFASFSSSFTVLYWFFFWSYLNQGSFFLRFSAYIHINSHCVLKACARKQTYEQGKKMFKDSLAKESDNLTFLSQPSLSHTGINSFTAVCIRDLHSNLTSQGGFMIIPRKLMMKCGNRLF